MMKKTVYLLLTTVIFLLAGCSVSILHKNIRPKYQNYKEIPGITQEEISALENLLAKRPRLVFGICVSTEAFLLDDGSVGGFAKLFCDRLSELFGFEFDFLPGSWEEMQERIVSKEIDLVGDFTATPERLQKFIMTDAIIQRTLKVFTDLNANRLNVTTARPIRCAFMNGSTTYSHVANSWEMPFEPVFIDDQSVVPELLLKGEIDAFIEEGHLEAAFDSYDFIKAEEYYPLTYSPISLTSGNSELAPVIDVMQKYLKNDGYYELTELYNQGYKDYLKNKLHKQLTEEEKGYIQRHNDARAAILVACEVDNYPTSFYNKKEKKFQGMALDTLNQISDLTGLVFRVGNKPDALWPELIGGLESGKYFIISELLRSSQRENRFLWADQPYCTNKYAMLSSADYPDVDINQILFSRIGLLEGAAHTDVFREWFPNSTNTKLYVSNTDAFAALVKGEIDLLMASENMLLNLTNYQEKPGFKANLVFNYSSNSFFGFNKDEEILCSIVNKTLRYINTEEITGWWQRKIFDYQSKIIKDMLPYMALFVVLLIAALFAVFVMYFRIKSSNRHLEAAVAERTRALAEQTNAAVAASRAKSDFLAKMSHEIRTPMNTITGMAELILHRELSPDVLAYVTDIKQAGANLLSIINDILDFSKVESGKMEIISAEYLFASLINDVIASARMRLTEKPLDFITDIDGAIPVKMIGDEVRIRQVLMNLLSNAVKYTKAGRVMFTAGCDAIKDGEVKLRFEVSDTGIGIRPEDIDKLFGDFVQFDSYKNKGVEGTGLGLAIARSLCRAMGGDITVSSVYGVGSVFTAVISQKVLDPSPAAAVKDIEAKHVLVYERKEIYADSLIRSLKNLGVRYSLARDREAFLRALTEARYSHILANSALFDEVRNILDARKAETKVKSALIFINNYGETAGNGRSLFMPTHAISIAGILNDIYATAGHYEGDHAASPQFIAPSARVLVVDDIATNLKVAADFLSLYKLRVDTCTSGAESLRLAKENRYDIIFMDHMMPEMDGVEATAMIRALCGDYFTRVPIIALTANAISGMREMFLEKGFNDYLSKPIEIQKLKEILNKWIPPEKRKSTDSAAEEDGAPVTRRLEIDGVDVEHGIQTMGGSEQRYRELLKIFREDVLKRLDIFRETPKNEDLQLFITQAHALKSAASNIGASSLSADAARLEDAGKRGDIAAIHDNLEHFREALIRLTESIQALS